LSHIAAAAGCPTVCLFGPTVAEKWGRHYHPHRVVVSPDGTMTGITVAAALAATQDLLAALTGT
jgi:ADP-heptose:LPS heptosyltransferase